MMIGMERWQTVHRRLSGCRSRRNHVSSELTLVLGCSGPPRMGREGWMRRDVIRIVERGPVRRRPQRGVRSPWRL